MRAIPVRLLSKHLLCEYPFLVAFPVHILRKLLPVRRTVTLHKRFRMLNNAGYYNFISSSAQGRNSVIPRPPADDESSVKIAYLCSVGTVS